METSLVAFLERFVAALGETIGFIGRWGQAFGSALLEVVIANLVTISLVALFYVSYRLLRAGLGTPIPNYRQVGSKRRTISAASMSMKFSTPGYICLLAALALLFAVGDARYLSALSSFVLVAAGFGSVWYGYRIHAAAPADGALASTEPKGLWLNRTIRAGAFAVLGLFVALLALGSLDTQVREQAAAFDASREERLAAVDQQMGEIVGTIEEAMAPVASEESQQALVPEL